MFDVASLGTVLAPAEDAALIANESGIILFANDQACNLFKYSPGELHGRTVEVLIPYRNRLMHIGHRLRFTDDRRTRPMGEGLKLFALCKDGSERPVDISLRPVQRGLETMVVATIQLREADTPTPSESSGAALDSCKPASPTKRQTEQEPALARATRQQDP